MYILPERVVGISQKITEDLNKRKYWRKMLTQLESSRTCLTSTDINCFMQQFPVAIHSIKMYTCYIFAVNYKRILIKM